MAGGMGSRHAGVMSLAYLTKRSFWWLAITILISTVSLISFCSGPPILSAQTTVQLPAPRDEWTPATIQQVTLNGALMIAVIFLWRSNQAERATAIQLAETTTAALQAAAKSNEELRHIIERLTDRLREEPTSVR
jgi:hypothetical protein